MGEGVCYSGRGWVPSSIYNVYNVYMVYMYIYLSLFILKD